MTARSSGSKQQKTMRPQRERETERRCLSMALTENIRQVQQRIQEAALRGSARDPGRLPGGRHQGSDLRDHPPGHCRRHPGSGENRVQEFNQHWADRGPMRGRRFTSSATCRRIRSNTWWEGVPDRVGGLGGADPAHRPGPRRRAWSRISSSRSMWPGRPANPAWLRPRRRS